mmetsp:Transcript_99312/g.286576  ORF Transcript_99312/g.286576 Transcript_99312/m.286576 type:complete len:247 (+) Transcript_99312:634-1374(+)
MAVVPTDLIVDRALGDGAGAGAGSGSSPGIVAMITGGGFGAPTLVLVPETCAESARSGLLDVRRARSDLAADWARAGLQAASATGDGERLGERTWCCSVQIATGVSAALVGGEAVHVVGEIPLVCHGGDAVGEKPLVFHGGDEHGELNAVGKTSLPARPPPVTFARSLSSSRRPRISFLSRSSRFCEDASSRTHLLASSRTAIAAFRSAAMSSSNHFEPSTMASERVDAKFSVILANVACASCSRA